MGKRKIFRALRVLFLSLTLTVAFPARSYAQFEVNDVLAMAQRVADMIGQIERFGESIGIDKESLTKLNNMRDWFNSSFGEGTNGAKVLQLLQDLGTLERLKNVLSSEMNMLQNYSSMMGNVSSVGSGISLTSSVLSTLTASVNTVKDLVAQANKVIADTGLSRNDKRLAVEKLAEQAERTQAMYHSVIADDIAAYNESLRAIQFNNFLSGLDPSFGLSGDNPFNENLVYRDEGSVDVDEAVGDTTDVSNLRNGYRNAFSTVSILLAFLCVLSVIIGFIRYTNGVPGGERVFVKIAVALAVVSVLLVSLTKFVGFGV